MDTYEYVNVTENKTIETKQLFCFTLRTHLTLEVRSLRRSEALTKLAHRFLLHLALALRRRPRARRDRAHRLRGSVRGARRHLRNVDRGRLDAAQPSGGFARSLRFVFARAPRAFLRSAQARVNPGVHASHDAKGELSGKVQRHETRERPQNSAEQRMRHDARRESFVVRACQDFHHLGLSRQLVATRARARASGGTSHLRRERDVAHGVLCEQKNR